MIKLIHSSISENGNSGWDGKAKAGDSTGKEVCVRSWYSKPWDMIIRYPDTATAKKAAKIAAKLANSNLVGYDQSERNTLYKTLKIYGFDADKYILSKSKTESDCSSFVYAVFASLIPEMRSDANAPTTSTMKTKFREWGFSVFPDYDKANSPDALKVGDILVKSGSHTAIVTTDLVLAETETKIEYADDVDRAFTIIALDVISGKWGNGEERKNNLYNAIQTHVNDLLK